ncbi:MAG: DUF427 domain-containing protein [Bacteroidales bacterium]
MKAIWNGKVIAESNNTKIVEGNHYFPMESVKKDFFIESETRSICPWKGTASYYNIKVDGRVNTDAAWNYTNPSAKAKNIKNHIAFWKGVQIVNQ